MAMSGNTNPAQDKDPARAVTPTVKNPVKNPYLLCKSVTGFQDRVINPGQLVMLMFDYMTVIDSPYDSLSERRNKKWYECLKTGLKNQK